MYGGKGNNATVLDKVDGLVLSELYPGYYFFYLGLQR
jgi:hypothetical protein